jgi:WD40 repeat protein
VEIENIKADAAKAYATRQEERADKQRENAVENEKRAKKAEITAKKNESIAKDNEIRANIKGFIVNLDRQEDNFRQRLAKAKELAVYSLTQSEDRELKALLALEAYKRNSHAYENLEQSTNKIYDDFKRLNARHNLERIPGVKDLKKKYRGLLRKSTARPPVPEMFDALRKAYIAKQGKQEDIIYPAAESWALAVTGDHSIVFNDRQGNLLLAPLQTTSGGGKIPVISKTGTVYLSLDTPMQASCFTAAADRLFCGTLNGKIVYWGTNQWREKGKELSVLHEAKILSMAYSTVKNLLVYSVKNVVYAHNLVDSAAPVLVLEQGNFIRALAVIEDHEEPVLLAADKQGNIFLSDLSARGRKKEKKKLNIDPRSGAFHALAYHPDMKWLALGNSRGEVRLFPGIGGKRLKAVKSGEELPHFVFDRKHKGIVRVLRFSAGGRCLASGGWDGTIMLWKVKEKDAAETVKQDPILTIRSQRKILSLVFASQEEYMIFSDDRHLRLCPTSPKPFRDVLLKRKKRGFGARETEMYLDETTKAPKPGPGMKGREK